MIGMGTAIILLSGALVVTWQSGSRARAENAQAQNILTANRKTVYVATENIDAGDKVVEGRNVVQQMVYSGMDRDIYMTADEMGEIALVPIASGVAVHKNMLGAAEITQDSREYELSVVNLMTTQADNDIVDVRILFPDGTDYTILSKKKISNLSLENSIFYTDMTEEEILRLSSATIDAYLTPGARIYTTRYLQPTVQEASVPYYPLRTNVIDLVHSDPNVLSVAQETLNASARNDLESRIGAMSEKGSGNISSGYADVDRARQQLISERREAESAAADQQETTAAEGEETAAEETTAAKNTDVVSEPTQRSTTETAAQTEAETQASTEAAVQETQAPISAPRESAGVIDLGI